MLKVIDLSHPIVSGSGGFPGDPAVRIERHSTIAAGGCNVSRVTMGSHQGTHLDAPRHLYNARRGVDELPLSACYGTASLVDLAPGTMLAAGTAIGVERLREHGRVFRSGGRVIYRTGWGRNWGRREFFRGYPSLTVEAARWIASRGVLLLGMDTPGPAEQWEEVHRILLGKGVVILESLANLERLPGRFTLMALPLRLRGVDGSPVRAAAVVGRSGRLGRARLEEKQANRR